MGEKKLESEKKENYIADEMDTERILDKLIELEKAKNGAKNNPTKIIICGGGGICTIMILGLLCYRLIKSDFSFESLLSILLAFFSIFISVFFYFKADETSTNFYKSSYDFMKDISVTLGKIEERFGEKLNNLNDKLSHLDSISTEKSKEIQEKKEDKDRLINDLIEKTNMGEKEKEKFKQQIRDKDLQIERLKNEQLNIRHETELLKTKYAEEIEPDYIIGEPSTSELFALLSGEQIEKNSLRYKRLKRMGYFLDDGSINERKIMKTLLARKAI